MLGGDSTLMGMSGGVGGGQRERLIELWDALGVGEEGREGLS